MGEEKKESLNFIEHIIEEDINSGKHDGYIHTRFPPEPNGYLHLGHSKALWVNFSISQKYGGKTNLRFDDTNPVTEDTEYVESIMRDIQWLGYQWDNLYFTSDYFGQLYDYAERLIQEGKAYVDDSSAEEIAELKGTPTKAGVDSPYRSRSVEENLALFRSMKAGEFDDGAKVLRAKIDMSSPNMHMRDPVIYRIKKATHHRTGDSWVIYPMYDFAHGQSDSIEGITHSLCSLEFRHHRPLYDWFIDNLEIYPSRQIEFARMNVSYMITSKRKLLKLVTENYVTGWDDPRMPTLSGMRRRGFPAEAIRMFCDKTGIAKRDILIEVEMLESCVRDLLNKNASRYMAVHDPIKLTIKNYPEDLRELLSIENNQEDPSAGKRDIPFSKSLYIERNDFKEEPQNKKYYRLAPGKNVRLKGAYIIHCTGFEKNDEGVVTEIFADYYPDSKSGEDVSGVKAKGTIHWVSQEESLPCEIRLYDRLFTDETPTTHEGVDYLDFFNEESLELNTSARVEPALASVEVGAPLQFMRIGYYTKDPDSTNQHLVFNRCIGLRDSWARKNK